MDMQVADTPRPPNGKDESNEPESIVSECVEFIDNICSSVTWLLKQVKLPALKLPDCPIAKANQMPQVHSR